LLEIAQGLGYLHSLNIIHGDLRGTNILISDDGHACLSDFGLATTFSEADSTAAMTSSSNRAGSARWFAPELIEPKSFGCERFVRTTSSDVYAYARVCLEVPSIPNSLVNIFLMNPSYIQVARLSRIYRMSRQCFGLFRETDQSSPRPFQLHYGSLLPPHGSRSRMPASASTK
jgi:serine/threonine protein kinase